MMTARLSTLVTLGALAALPMSAAPGMAAGAAPAASAFRHHITGTVVELSGASLGLRLRTGERVSIDIGAAQRTGQIGVLPFDRPVTVYGERGSDGRFHATSIGHAAPTPRNWPEDAT